MHASSSSYTPGEEKEMTLMVAEAHWKRTAKEENVFQINCVCSYLLFLSICMCSTSAHTSDER